MINIEILKQYKQIAIIGTDTEVGKTYVSVYLMNNLKKFGLSVTGLKPIASGAVTHNGQLANEDALALQNASSNDHLAYNLVNFNLYGPAIAPHIAAQKVGEYLNVEKLIKQTYKSFERIDSDIILIEGAGGLLTPLNYNQTWADYLRILNIPVLLVVGMRLGCINHALLTAEYLYKYNMHCVGWVANCIVPEMPVLEENITTLDQMLTFPRISRINFDQN